MIGSDYEMQLGGASQNDTRRIRGAILQVIAAGNLYYTRDATLRMASKELIGQSIPGSYVTFEFHIYTAKKVGKRTFER